MLWACPPTLHMSLRSPRTSRYPEPDRDPEPVTSSETLVLKYNHRIVLGVCVRVTMECRHSPPPPPFPELGINWRTFLLSCLSRVYVDLTAGRWGADDPP